jgi:hypothetical protein
MTTLPILLGGLGLCLGSALGFLIASAFSSGRSEDAFRAGYSAGRVTVILGDRDLGEIERHWSDGTD